MPPLWNRISADSWKVNG